MYIIGNGVVFTRDNALQQIENGAVAVEGQVIVALGTSEELQKKYPQAQFIDAKGGIIMPALINTHLHIYSAMARGISINNYQPQNFLEILEGLWWNIDQNLTLEDTKYSAYTTLINCIENGIGTVFDHHASYYQTKGSLFEIGKVADELGLKANLCYEISDRHGKVKMEEALQENLDFVEYVKTSNSQTLRGMIGLHASFTLSDESLAYITSRVPSDVGYHVHVAEGILDQDMSLEQHGVRVVNRLDQFGIINENSIAGHCVHVNEEEMAILKNKKMSVIHNPESNMANAIGIPKVIELMDKGILVGLGTDGYTNDMFESYKVANIIHKHENQDSGVAWTEIPTMLFENNAILASKHFPLATGKLKEGYAAD
ncbi:MAG: putative aminohydrolase SsnA, partial [Bacilli bacterium]